jgi:hypothetical protein
MKYIASIFVSFALGVATLMFFQGYDVDVSQKEKQHIQCEYSVGEYESAIQRIGEIVKQVTPPDYESLDFTGTNGQMKLATGINDQGLQFRYVVIGIELDD